MGLSTKSISKGVSKAVKSGSKAVSKTVSKAAAPVSKAASTAVKSAGSIAKSAVKGDVKGVAGGAMSAVQGAKDLAKGTVSQAIGANTTALRGLGGLTGLKAISSLSKNVDREANKGVNTYGDAAIDIGANIATTGAYGAAQGLTSGLAQGGLSSLTKSDFLKDQAMSYGAKQFGIDPSILKMGASAAQGDLRGAALKGLSSYSGMDEDNVNLISGLAGGDVKGALIDRAVASGGEYIPEEYADSVSTLASGNLRGALVQGAGSKMGLTEDQRGIMTKMTGKNPSKALEDLAKNEAMKSGRGFVSGMDLDPEQFEQYIPEGVVESGKVSRDAFNQMRGQAQDIQSTIKKGDTLGAIAKRHGMTVQQLMAANPNIKDANKIAAGMKLNIPQFGATAPVNQARVKTDEQIAAQKNATDQAEIERATGTTQAKEPGFFDKVGNWLGDNKAVAGGIANVAGAGLGYLATENERKKQEGIIGQQLDETKKINALDELKLNKERDASYKDTQGFLKERIAGGGVTAKEKQMRAEGDIRAARAGAAGRLAGIEQQARMGRGASGSGASLAASLLGAQGGASDQYSANLARETSAAANLERAQMARPELEEQRARTDISLAQSRDATNLDQQKQMNAIRDKQLNLSQARGGAMANLAAEGSNALVSGINDMKGTTAPLTAEQQRAKLIAEQEQQIKINENKAKLSQADQFNDKGVVKKTPPPTNTLNQMAAGAKKDPVGTAMKFGSDPKAGISGIAQGAKNQATQAVKSKVNTAVSSVTKKLPPVVQGVAKNFVEKASGDAGKFLTGKSKNWWE